MGGHRSPTGCASHSLVLRARRRRALDGRADGDRPAGEEDALDLRVRVRDWPAADLTRALAWDVDLQGPVTGEATVRGRRSAPEGYARFTQPAGRYYGVPYEALDVAARAARRGRPR